ncbi:P-loop ATPase, Sll1717 family [Roseateles sp. LYH14W]|uniref:P-loop ATPase, Sll1717 family n=1 Tax=Pelomonas parva TaxID=3299032 RepID=A0ABW7FE30_9BURK
MKYVFKRNGSIGAMDAESDAKFLADCFFDTGDVDVLLDCEDPKRIVVGRVGAGKSALLEQLKTRSSNVIDVRAEELSLNYVANSDVIQFFEAAGVKLDLFYQLLWKHVFVVELLKKRYRITEKEPRSHWDFLKDVFSRDPAKERAVKYLEQWGDRFWQDTEIRIKEFTTRLEEKLSAAVDAKIFGASLNAQAARALSEEVKAEIVHKAQSIVNSNQVRELTEVVSLLAEVIFIDPMNRHHIVIDRLDESWVDERIRYKLIRALIETVRAFQRIRAVKIVISMREDLLRRVFDATRDAGFQEEKYETLFLRVRWKKHQLMQLLEMRLNRLVREQYTTKSIAFNDVFRGDVRKESAIDYVVDRSLLRPRDVISFVNCCIELCEGKEYITPSAVQDAEKKYSEGRLRSLFDEWRTEFPNLSCCVQLLRGRASSFKYSELSDEDVQRFMSESFNEMVEDDFAKRAISEYLINNRTLSNCLIQIVKIIYTASVVGIKPQATDKTSWAHNDDRGITEGQYKSSSTIYVHKMLWRALDIQLPPRGAV